MIKILLLISQPLFARAYGGPNEDWANSAIQTPDGGFLVAGSTWGFGSVWVDVLILRLSPAGGLEWAKTIGGEGPEWVGDVVRTQDGGFLIAGYTASFGAQVRDALAVKLTGSGDLEWAKVYGGPLYDIISSAASLDTGFALAGGRYTDATRGFDLLLISLSEAGTMRWARVLVGQGPDFGEDVLETDGGCLMVAGWTLSWGAGYSDFLVASLAPDGSLNWARTYGSPEHDAGFGIARVTDGGFIVAGETWGFGAIESDILLLRIDATGGIVWARRYEGPGSERALSVLSAPDGGFVVAGETDDPDVLILRVSENGDLLWAKSFGGTKPDTLGTAILTSDGDLMVIGSTVSAGAGLSDMFALRFPLDGDYPDCLSRYPLSVKDVSPAVEDVPDTPRIYAPKSSSASPTLTAQFPSAADICPPGIDESAGKPGQPVLSLPIPGGAMFISSEATDMRIYAVDGRLVYSGGLSAGKNTISLDPGVYLWLAGKRSGRVAVR